MRELRSTVAFLVLACAVAACSTSASVSPSLAETAAASPAAPTPSATANLSDQIPEVLDAAETTLAEGTVRIEQTLVFSGSSVIPNGTKGSANGHASFGEPTQHRLSADFNELGLGDIVMIRDDSLVYMRGTVFERLVGPRRWLLVDLESDDPAAAPFKGIASGQNDVSMALFYLYGATDILSIGGGETIRGQSTSRFSIEIDLEAAREEIPEERREALEDLIATFRTGGIERTVDADVWVGQDGRIHRLRYVYQLGPVSGGGTMESVIDFSEFGEPLRLGIPPDRQVVRVEDVRAGDAA